MIKWFKRKRRKIYHYYCKHCDIFFDTYKDWDYKCPGCGRRGSLWSVKERDK